jgi:putative hemolysin
LGHGGWGALALVAVLIGFSALYSMAETAVMSLSRGRARQLVEEGVPEARTLEHMSQHPNRILGTVLVGNNLANIAASAVATALLLRLYGSLGVTISTVVMTLIVLLLAEITPKTYAAHHPDRVAVRLARFLVVSMAVFTPVVKVLTAIGVGALRLLGIRAEGGRLVTEEEIRTLVDVGQEEGLLEAEEREMIQGIFELSDTPVREVMVPRIDIDAIEIQSTLKDAWEAVIQAGHSRLPVYRRTVDDIVGMLYARDILAYVRERSLDTPVETLLRPVYYVPETRKVDELLRDFRRERIHIAIVLDEFGGTAGLVTMEDLLEEIVGEIQDEYAQDEPEMREIEPGRRYEVDGRVTLDDLRDQWGIELEAEDIDTVGGFILDLLGRAPVQGETVRYGPWELTAAQVKGRRVKRLGIRRVDAEIQEGSDAAEPQGDRGGQGGWQ